MDPTKAGVASPPHRERRLWISAVLPAAGVLLLWCVHLLDLGFELDLYRYGTYPRTFHGAVGILLSPFVHGDLEHLVNNSIPLFVLGWALLYFFPRLAGRVILASWLVSGCWVWLSARSSYHIGASGVVYGMAAFLFTSGLLRRQRALMGLSLLVVFLYGGLIWGVFPLFPKVSWESHLWGAVAGTAMAFLYRTVPSAVHEPGSSTYEDDAMQFGEDVMPSAGEECDEHGARSWRSTHTWEPLPGWEREDRNEDAAQR